MARINGRIEREVIRVLIYVEYKIEHGGLIM